MYMYTHGAPFELNSRVMDEINLLVPALISSHGCLILGVLVSFLLYYILSVLGKCRHHELLIKSLIYLTLAFTVGSLRVSRHGDVPFSNCISLLPNGHTTHPSTTHCINEAPYNTMQDQKTS